MRKNKTEISVLPQCSTLRTLLAILSLCLLSISSAGEDVFAGFEAYHRGDYATALKKFRPLAEQGHPKAQYHLGLMYESGRGVVPDKEGSEKWYRLAYQKFQSLAEEGDVEAQVYLGMMYYNGHGVDQNLEEAVKWLQKVQKVQGVQTILDRIAGAKSFATLEHDRNVASVAFSPDGKTLASGSEYGTIRAWNVNDAHRSPSPLPPLEDEGHSWSVTSVAFSPDSRMVAWSGKDNIITLWIFNNRIVKLEGHNRDVTSMVFSPNSKILASGSDDNTIILWHVAEKPYDILWNNPKLDTLKRESVTSVAFSPDGRILASGSNDKTIILRDVAKRYDYGRLKGHIGYVTSVAFSPDGRILASGSNDKTIRLWEVKSGRAIAQLKGHTDYVTSVAFSPDGRILASGSNDETIILWNWNVAKPLGIAMLKGHTDYVTSVAFSPNGRILASGSDDDTIKLWEVKSGCTIVQAIFSDSTYVLNAGEAKTLKIRIRNDGFEDARDLTVELRGKQQEGVVQRFDVPIIPKSGGERTVDIPIHGGHNLPTDKGLLNIHVNGPHFKDKIEGKQLRFETRASGYFEFNLSSVKNIVFESEQMENGPAPTDMKITMIKEVEAVKVSHTYLEDFKQIDPDSITITEKARGSGKDWKVKIEDLQLEKQVVNRLVSSTSSNKIYAAITDEAGSVVVVSDNIGEGPGHVWIIVEWTNKDGTTENISVPIRVQVKETRENDGTIERKVVSVSLVKSYPLRNSSRVRKDSVR